MIHSAVHAESRESGRVLVYDDDQVLLGLLGLVLTREGHHIKATISAEEGMRLVSTELFDLAVADLGLRRSNGHELVRKIKEVSPQTVIVAVSACPSDEVVRFAREYAHAFLDKPFSLAELVTAFLLGAERALFKEKPQAGYGSVHCIDNHRQVFTILH